MRKSLIQLILIIGLTGMPASAGENAADRVVTCTTSMFGIELRLKMPTVNPPGKPVIASLVLKNNSGQTISYQDRGSLVRIEVRDRQGKPVPSKGKGIMPGPDLDSLGLRPGEEISCEYDLTSRYVLETKGSYTFTAYRTFNEYSGANAWGLLMIKEVDFYVGEAPNPFRTDD